MTRKYARLALAPGSLALALVFGACGGDDESGSDDAGGTDQTQEDGGSADDGGEDAEGSADDNDDTGDGARWPDAVLDEPAEIRLGLFVPGMQEFFINAMRDAGIDEMYNLELSTEEVQSPAAGHLLIAEKEVDIGFGGITACVQARAEGRGTVIVNALSGTNTQVLTPEDSDIESASDLEGTRWASYSSPGSVTFMMFEALVEERYGFNIRQDSEITEAAAPAIVGFMEQGELEAGMLGSIDSIRTVLDGGYRTLIDLPAEWVDEYGSLPGTVMVCSNDDFVGENPEAVVAFNAAFAETMDYIEANPAVWENYAEAAELPMDGGPEMLQERIGERLIRTWDDETVQAHNDLIEIFIEYADPDTFVDEIPEGMFNVDLQPE